MSPFYANLKYISGLLIVVALSVSIANAAEANRPLAATLYNKNSSIYSMDKLEFLCVPIATNQIKCDFTQVRITNNYRNHVNDEAKQKKVISEIKGESSKLTSDEELQSFKNSDICSSKTLMSSKLADYKKQNEALNLSWKDDRRVRSLNQINKLCENPSAEGLITFLESRISNDSCSIFTNTYSLTFLYQNSTKKWLSQGAASGSCGTVVIATLSNEKDDLSSWVYTQDRVVTNREGPLCSIFEEKKQEYSWESSFPMLLNCKYFDQN